MNITESVTSLLAGLNAHTRGGEGISRFTYTPEYKAAVQVLKKRMQLLGLAIREDAVGTLYGVWQGSSPALPPLMTGSHLDTVPHGGRYDGAAGIACALAAVEALKTEGFTPCRTLIIAAFAEEEGTRWADSMFSSRYIAGEFTPALLEGLDPDGVTLREALTAYGVTELPAVKTADPLCGFLELHIEQGPVLEQHAAEIGVVTAICGMQNIEVTVRGSAGHAGTTPMQGRNDALCAASLLIPQIRDAALTCGEGAVATVGRFSVLPGGANIIPGEVRFTVDLRAPAAEPLQRLSNAILSLCTFSGQGITATAAISYREPPAALDAGMQQRIKAAADALGLRSMALPSGAGHDSMVMAAHYPTGMIFIPCKNGRSHCPEESTSPQQLVAGALVLKNVITGLIGSAGL